MTQPNGEKKFSGLQVLGIAFLVMIVAVTATIFVARTWLFPRPFKPVVLTPQEEKRLEHKLRQLELPPTKPAATRPKAARETGSDRLPDGRLQR
ncbi:MAG: hypothetical protein JRJ56_07990 [Deltaproteobacteria bacterium]|nr:hypothetical protein [Deltaproteobacteria bacterium]